MCVWREKEIKLLFPVYCNPRPGQSREFTSICSLSVLCNFKIQNVVKNPAFLLKKKHPVSLRFYKYKGFEEKELWYFVNARSCSSLPVCLLVRNGKTECLNLNYKQCCQHCQRTSGRPAAVKEQHYRKHWLLNITMLFLCKLYFVCRS